MRLLPVRAVFTLAATCTALLAVSLSLAAAKSRHPTATGLSWCAPSPRHSRAPPPDPYDGDGESEFAPPPKASSSSSCGGQRPATLKFADLDDSSDDGYDRPAPAWRPVPSPKSSKWASSSRIIPRSAGTLRPPPPVPRLLRGPPLAGHLRHLLAGPHCPPLPPTPSAPRATAPPSTPARPRG